MVCESDGETVHADSASRPEEEKQSIACDGSKSDTESESPAIVNRDIGYIEFLNRSRADVDENLKNKMVLLDSNYF